MKKLKLGGVNMELIEHVEKVGVTVWVTVRVRLCGLCH